MFFQLLLYPLLSFHFGACGIFGFPFFIPLFPFPSLQTSKFSSKNNNGRLVICDLEEWRLGTQYVFFVFVLSFKSRFFNVQWRIISTCEFLSFPVLCRLRTTRLPVTSQQVWSEAAARTTLQLVCRTKRFWLLRFFAPLLYLWSSYVPATVIRNIEAYPEDK